MNNNGYTIQAIETIETFASSIEFNYLILRRSRAVLDSGLPLFSGLVVEQDGTLGLL